MPSSPASLPLPQGETQATAADDSVVDLIAELASTDARFTQLALKQTEADQTEGPTQATVAASKQAVRDDHEETAAADSSPIAALQLTPEQDAAAEECCVQFVDQYEHVGVSAACGACGPSQICQQLPYRIIYNLHQSTLAVCCTLASWDREAEPRHAVCTGRW